MKLGKAVFLILAGAVMTASLSACSNAKRALGVEKISPDEFTVVTKAPLVVPPDYSLRPPQPGKNSPAYIAPDGRAQFALFGQDGSRVDGFSQGETSILEITGGAKADRRGKCATGSRRSVTQVGLSRASARLISSRDTCTWRHADA